MHIDYDTFKFIDTLLDGVLSEKTNVRRQAELNYGLTSIHYLSAQRQHNELIQAKTVLANAARKPVEIGKTYSHELFGGTGTRRYRVTAVHDHHYDIVLDGGVKGLIRFGSPANFNSQEVPSEKAIGAMDEAEFVRTQLICGIVAQCQSYLLDHCPDGQPWEDFDPDVDGLCTQAQAIAAPKKDRPS